MAKNVRRVILQLLSRLARVLTAGVTGMAVATVYFGLDFISRAENEAFTGDRTRSLRWSGLAVWLAQ